MAVRVQVVLEPEERERFRHEAERLGMSLSAWLRRAGREQLAAGTGSRRMRGAKALRAFFRQCDARESGREPDWEVHKHVIESAAASGRSDT